DLNADGNADLVALVPGSASVGAALGNGDGTFATPSTSALAGTPYGLAIGDVNADEKPDVAIATSSGIVVRLGNGDGTFASSSPFGTFSMAVAIGEFDGDGKADLAVPGASFVSEGTNLKIYRGNGNGTFAAAASHAVGTVDA